MSLEIDLNGCSRYISVWKIYFVEPVLCKLYLKSGGIYHLDSNHVIFHQNLFLDCNLRCICMLAFCHTIMTDKKSSGKPVILNVTINVKNPSQCHVGNCVGEAKSDGDCLENKMKNGHADDCESDTSETLKSSKLPSQDVNSNCEDRTESGSSVWQRRDSFSSCSSDSAVYCSSRHAQIDTGAHNVTQNYPTDETNGKKRHRNSSGSSVLSSASDSSNKDASHVTKIFSFLKQNSGSTKQSLSELSDDAKSEAKAQSLTHLPEAVSSGSKITLPKQPVLYACRSKPIQNVHNLRRQIRRKTCHNCDCNGAHAAVLVRRFPQIKHDSTNRTLPKVKSLRVLSQHRNHLAPKFISPSNSSQMYPLQKEHPNRRRRTEVDKLYDALHEIHWAKHMSPDNILSQIDFRRAATLSVYSSKDRDAVQKFKSPLCPKKNHYVRNSRNKLAATCSKSLPSVMCKNDSTNSSANSVESETVDENLGVLDHEPVDVLENSCDLSRSESSAENQELQTSNLEKFNVNTDNQESLCSDDNESKSGASSFDDHAYTAGPKDALVATSIETNHQVLTAVEEGSQNYAVVDSNGDIVALLFDSDDCQIWDAPQNEELVEDDSLTPGMPNQLQKEVDVIYEPMYPDIVDVETTEICVDEGTCNAVVPSSLPILTRIEPATEYLSSDSPPHLEPAVSCTASPCKVGGAKCGSSSPPELGSPQYTASRSFEQKEKLRSPEQVTVKQRSSRQQRLPRSKLEKIQQTKELALIYESLVSNVPENVKDKDNKAVCTSSLQKHVKKHRAVTKKNPFQKNLLKKYFKKPKPRLRCNLKKSLSEEQVKELGKNILDTEVRIPPIHPNNPHPFPLVINVYNEECKRLIKEDKFRVSIQDLKSLECYKHIFKQEGGITCSIVQRSEVMCDNKKCLQLTKQEVHFKTNYEERRRYESVKISRPLPLELRDAGHMPCNFTVHYRYITVNKNTGYTQVILKLTEGHNIYLSANALNELRDALYSASADPECQVLVMNSIGKSFCMGLDLRPLIEPQKNSACREIAFAVKSFIEALASFNKPLVVVVNGAAVGLGVTLLTYSDVIISSESATFHMPYSSLGYCPEGGATLMLPFVIGSTLAMDMLLRGRTLSAYEAYDYGLVSEVLTASRLPRRLVERVRQLAESPTSAMQNTKFMLRMHMYQRLGTTLEAETAMLLKQWLSEPCQSALQKFLKKDSPKDE